MLELNFEKMNFYDWNTWHQLSMTHKDLQGLMDWIDEHSEHLPAVKKDIVKFPINPSDANGEDKWVSVDKKLLFDVLKNLKSKRMTSIYMVPLSRSSAERYEKRNKIRAEIPEGIEYVLRIDYEKEPSRKKQSTPIKGAFFLRGNLTNIPPSIGEE